MAKGAILCFEKGGADHRLPAACLSLARVLLPDKDSLREWKVYYEKGLGYAIAYRDTARLVEAMDQKVMYLRLYTKDFAEAAVPKIGNRRTVLSGVIGHFRTVSVNVERIICCPDWNRPWINGERRRNTCRRNAV